MGTGCDRTLIQQLTRGGNNKGPSFSLDGQWITYASERDGDNEVMIVRVDGSDIRVLTSNNYPDWQPRWGR
jgi:Tol biopolymer transport system component